MKIAIKSHSEFDAMQEKINDAPKSAVAWRRRRADVGVVFLIFLFFIIFFRRGLFGGEFLLISDPLVYSHPLRATAWEMIRGGLIPLWTPHVFSGYPMMSMAQLGLAYPLTWGYLFLPGPWAEQIYVLAPFLLAPIFTFAFVRAIGRSRPAALLAGLSFGYGGMMASWLTNGLMTNAVIWLPLMLIGVWRARTHRFIPCLLIVAGGYALSLFSGVGQGFVLVGVVTLAYACFWFIAGAPVSEERDESASRWLSRRRWMPLAVASGGILLAAGVAAFQIFESWQAVSLSVRRKLSYELFSHLSYSPAQAWRSLLAPIYNYLETTTFVLPLALLLALAGVIAAFRRPHRDPQVFFWLAVAVIAWLLLLGPHTPFHGLVYRIPILNNFRAPSRHTFEWSFAVSILAAYGWDAIVKCKTTKSPGFSLAPIRSGLPKLFAGGLILLLIAVVGASWLVKTPLPAAAASDGSLRRLEDQYLLWKAALTFATLIALWFFRRVETARWRAGLLTLLVFVVGFVEPYIICTRWWGYLGIPASRMTTVSPTSRWLQNFSPSQNRVYTRVRLFSEEYELSPILDSPNLTALAGLHNVAGYEPLMLERYSRALGNVWLDGVTPLAGSLPDASLFEPQSRVLDLLNARFVVAFSNLAIDRTTTSEKEGIAFDKLDLPPEASSNGVTKLSTTRAEGDTVALVTTLSNSGELVDGAPVARVDVHTTDGRLVTRELRAGIDSAEWAYERPDVRAVIRHAVAPIFESSPGDAQKSFQAHRYWSRLSLGQRLDIERVEIAKLLTKADVTVWKGSIYDSSSGRSTTLVADRQLQAVKNSARWQMAYQHDGAIILENRRVLPRAWLVSEARSVNSEDALRLIRGESDHPFDPARTALMEADPGALTALPGGNISSEASAEVAIYEPHRLVIETKADHPTVLVVSEINYPGWVAMIDGVKATVHQTNYLLRGMILPAGAHRVEMWYSAPAMRMGAYISALALTLILVFAIYDRYRQRNSR